MLRSVLVLLALAVPAQGAPPPSVTLELCDGSILKGVTLPAVVEIATRYGRLVVPSKDIRRVEVGLRLGGLPWLEAWEQDTVSTADCVLTGRLEAKALKVRSRVLGEVSVRVADVRLVQGGGDRPVLPAPDVAAQQKGIQQIAQLAQSGENEVILINKVRTDGIVYTLTADQIAYLKQNKVNEAVITEMQATAYRLADPRPPASRVANLPPLPSAPESTPPLPPLP